MPAPFSNVCVVGLGYIGLPTAAAFATRGLDVIGVDVNEGTVDLINAGKAPFVEPDLEVAVSGAVAMGRLRAFSVPQPAEAFILAVPTPFHDDKSANLKFVRSAAESVAPVLKSGDLVVLESTSPPGTTRLLSGWLANLRPDLAFPHEGRNAVDVRVAHCPERVLPGRIMIEMITNDRIIGGISTACAERARDLYSIFTQGAVHLTDASTAEVAKVTENAFRDVNIAFANELSLLCDDIGLDVHEVIELANRHPRVQILQPGPGVGGHCIAVDPWFLVAASPEHTPLMRTARAVNDGKPRYIVEQVNESAARFKDPTVACLGLAFKANVEDLRESPAMEIVLSLACSSTLRVMAVEPHIDRLPDQLANTTNVQLVSYDAAIERSDIVVLLVDHDAFRSVKKSSLRGKVVLDTRGLWR